MKHLEVIMSNILSEGQHRFRARHSYNCETQLLEFVEELQCNNKAGHQTDDFSKAFDKVCHTRLLYKLQWYGIRNKRLNWIYTGLSI